MPPPTASTEALHGYALIYNLPASIRAAVERIISISRKHVALRTLSDRGCNATPTTCAICSTKYSIGKVVAKICSMILRQSHGKTACMWLVLGSIRLLALLSLKQIQTYIAGSYKQHESNDCAFLLDAVTSQVQLILQFHGQDKFRKKTQVPRLDELSVPSHPGGSIILPGKIDKID